MPRDRCSEIEIRFRCSWHPCLFGQSLQLLTLADRVLIRGSEGRKSIDQAEGPQRCCNDAKAHAGIASFQSLEGIEADHHPLRQQPLGGTATLPCYGDILGEDLDRFGCRGRKGLGRARGFCLEGLP